MSELNHIKKLIEQLYPISVVAIHSLQQHVLDWRGVYRVDAVDGQVWVLRMVQRHEPTPWLQQPATVLRWLAGQGYNAPEVLLTAQGNMVGAHPQWWMLMTSYIHGHVANPTAADLRLLGAAAARLHCIPVTNSSFLPQSWWDHQTAFPVTCQQLLAGLARTPPHYQPLVRELIVTMDRLQHRVLLPLTLLHGDCWHANAVRTPYNGLILIDWDCAGLGQAVLDLGNVLLTCHYDLSAPLVLEPDQSRIQAIMDGYQSQRPLTEQERTSIPDAIRFPLAFHAGQYLEHVSDVRSEDFFLQKLQARFDITEEVSRVALMCVA